MVDSSLLEALACSFLAGDSTVDGIVARASHLLGRRWRWLRPLAERYTELFSGQTRPRQSDVIRFLLGDPGLVRARAKYQQALRVNQWLTEPLQMQPAAAAKGWEIPEIESPRALAKWLGVNIGRLRWMADLKRLGCQEKNSRLHHYHYRVLAKQSGSVRLIEAPKSLLKRAQRQILTGILEAVPAHSAAHGFIRGRSIKTFATPHVGQRVVLRMDLQDFFPSFAAARIQAFFRTLGYPEAVADLLGGICTNATPKTAWQEAAPTADPIELRHARFLYARRHLPQGAPTSPALANACTFRTDCRLAGLAESVGAQYSRYADDLAFSSGEIEFEKGVERFSTHVAAILMEEGFAVRHRKTRVMRRGVRQYLAGIVTNRHLNVIRADFDRLKAVLTNCVRHGPDSQNRDRVQNFRLYLEGRVAFVEMINKNRGGRLRAIFERIPWT